MAYRYELWTADGDHADSITTSESGWQPGDTVIGQGNTRWRVTAVLPGHRVDEFVDGREVDGILEVEPL
jgi:hypothetical protein